MRGEKYIKPRATTSEERATLQAKRQVVAQNMETPAHPPEATYPCCIPALGGLGDVVPRGGSTYITRFWLQVERKSQASAPLGALLGAPHAFTMFFCSLNICIKLRLICLNISSNIALNEFARLAIFMLNSWRLHKVGARSQNRA